MLRYILKRLAYGLAVATAVVWVITTVIYNGDMDPADFTFGQWVSKAQIEEKRKELGLDQPLHRQQLDYLRDISPIALSNDSLNQLRYRPFLAVPLGKASSLVLKAPYFGRSFQSGEKVSYILRQRIPSTLILALGAILLAMAVGIPLGVAAALNSGSWGDRIAVVGSVLGYSIPSYVMGLLLVFLMAYWLGGLTGLNMNGGLIDLDDNGERVIVWKNLILPVLALGIRPIGIFTQLTRSAVLDVLGQDYVRTARAKGLPAAKVNRKHVLRNALNPVSTAVTGWFASLLSGAFFVEYIFNYNGLGTCIIEALKLADIPVILGVVVFTALAFVFINILSDLLYAWLDPRVRLQD